ncbi:oligosaccharide flippase family protein [Patescibacteria group bacterium]|nr:oligosaccharide flippase family protein [Patescibacteria group bacterium]
MVRALLHKVEKYVKTDIRYLVKGGSLMVTGQIAVSAIALCTSIAFANLLSKEAYGTYQYILTTVEFLLSFSLIGLGRSVVTSVSRGHEGALDHGFRAGLIWGTGALILGVCVGGYYLYKEDILFGVGIIFGTFATLLITTFKIYIPFLNGKKLFGLTSSFTVFGILIPGIAVIVTLFQTTHLLTILIVFFISSTLTNLILFVLSRRYATNSLEDPKMIRQAFHLSLDSLIGRVAALVDRILLFHFAGPAILAEFWIAQNIERQFSHLFKSANSVALPKLSVRSYEELRQSMPRKVLLLYILIIPFTVGYILITPFIFQLAFPQYLSAVLYAQVLGLLLLFSPIKALLDVFIGHSMHTILYKINTGSALAQLVTTCSLVPFFGIWGVIASIFMNQIAYAAGTLWYFLRKDSGSM